VNSVSAATANVVNGGYKIARPFIILYKKETISPEARMFLDWIMSGEGQNIVGTSWISVK
jgi:phosphate transport system substrate-binding protein